MSDPVHVLVWGTAAEGACAYFRGHLFDEPLKEQGVELRHITKLEFSIPAEYKGREAEALHAGKVELDLTDLEWADVVMVRRYYNTSIKCGREPSCGFLTQDKEEAVRHPHGFKQQDSITRDVWPAIRDNWTGGIVYETDDNHWKIQPWNGYYPDVLQERDLIADMTRRADLVTVAVPALVPWYGKYNPRIRVIRNAIDPDLYVKDTPHPGGDKPRLVYYGSTARMRDYGGRTVTANKRDGGGFARLAVDAHRHLLHRVFLGTNPDTEHIIERLFDEQHPYIDSIAGFSKALTNLHGDIGIAPLGGDEFDRCKSELHWLEYAMADMAFIGERYSGGDGPYQVIREGVDGLLARGAQEWHDAVGKLAKSKDLRDELAGRAKERVLAEYDYRVRAQEWADAFRWAAEHAGIGARQLAAA